MIPGKKVRIIAGRLKGKIKTVKIRRGDRLLLKDALKEGMNKKLYSASVHISKVKLQE